MGTTASFLDIPGGHGFKRVFICYSKAAHDKFLSKCKKIMARALSEEIFVNIKQKLRDRYSDMEIKTYVNDFITGKHLEGLPNDNKRFEQL